MLWHELEAGNVNLMLGRPPESPCLSWLSSRVVAAALSGQSTILNVY